MNTIAFFNNKGGVGKTSLLFNVAHAMAASGLKVVVADLDPQANLTSFFLTDAQIAQLWDDTLADRTSRDKAPDFETVFSSLQPLLEGEGDIVRMKPMPRRQNLWLLPGDLRLSDVEDELSAQWPRCLNGEVRAFRVTAAFHKMLTDAADQCEADIVLVDVGPNLGAINRAALVASDFLVVPMGADLFSNRGIQNLGPKLSQWRAAWGDRLARAPERLREVLPRGRMEPLGFTTNIFNTYNGNPAQAFAHWVNLAPGAFAKLVNRSPGRDRLADVKNYNALMPAAQRSRKPIFELSAADGVYGAQITAAKACGNDMMELARAIQNRIIDLSPIRRAA